MKLCFHIGAEKTGSTAIQSWLHKNSAALRKKGIWYSEALGRPNNTGIYLWAGGVRPDEGFLFYGAVSDEQKLQFINQTKEKLLFEIREAKNAGSKIFVISNEHCHSRLLSPKVIQNTADLLTPLFSEVKIYFVIRPQLEMCLSLASTRARVGGEVTADWFNGEMSPSKHYFNYRQVLQKWSGVYGKEAIHPVSYKRIDNIISFFCEEFGIDQSEFSSIPRINEALDYRTIAISNALQFKLHRADGRANKNANFFIEKIPVLERLQLGRSFAQTLQSRFDESNNSLVTEWPQIKISDLQIDWQSYPELGNIDRLDNINEFASVIKFIIEQFNALSWLDRAQLKQAEAKLCEAKGELLLALKLIDESLIYAQIATEVSSVASEAESFIRTQQSYKDFLLENSKFGSFENDRFLI
jgi:hypothetical protein